MDTYFSRLNKDELLSLLMIIEPKALHNICAANDKLNDICNDIDFQRRYYEKWCGRLGDFVWSLIDDQRLSPYLQRQITCELTQYFKETILSTLNENGYIDRHGLVMLIFQNSSFPSYIDPGASKYINPLESDIEESDMPEELFPLVVEHLTKNGLGRDNVVNNIIISNKFADIIKHRYHLNSLQSLDMTPIEIETLLDDISSSLVTSLL
jgi:hypothetical protein